MPPVPVPPAKASGFVQSPSSPGSLSGCPAPFIVKVAGVLVSPWIVIDGPSQGGTSVVGSAGPFIWAVQQTMIPSEAQAAPVQDAVIVAFAMAICQLTKELRFPLGRLGQRSHTGFWLLVVAAAEFPRILLQFVQ